MLVSGVTEPTWSLNRIVPAVLMVKVLAPSIVLLKLMLPSAAAPVELRTVLLNSVIASLYVCVPVVAMVGALIWTKPGASVVNWPIVTALSNRVVPLVFTVSVLSPPMVLLKLTLPNAPAPVEFRTVLANRVIGSL